MITFPNFLFFALFAATVSAELTSLRHAWRLHSHSVDRFKRQANNYQQGNNGEGSSLQDMMCPLQCFGIVVNTVMDSMNSDSPFNIQQIGQMYNQGQYFTEQDKQKFRDACKTYQDLKNCWRPCPDSFLTQMTRSTYETMDYVCGANYADWETYMPCYIEVGQEGAAQCAQQCQNVTQGVLQSFGRTENNQNDQYGSQQGYDDIFGGLLDSSCQFLQCTTDCERPLIMNKCGERAAKLLEGLVATSVGSLQQLINTGSQYTEGNNNVFPNNNNQNSGFQQNRGNMPYSCNRLMQQYSPNRPQG